MEAVLDAADVRWLREQVEFFVVPFMDKDGVEAGDQGKNRRPYDHNRDYQGESLYASVRAMRELVTAGSARETSRWHWICTARIFAARITSIFTSWAGRRRITGRGWASWPGCWRRCSAGRFTTARRTTSCGGQAWNTLAVPGAHLRALDGRSTKRPHWHHDRDSLRECRRDNGHG